MSEGSALQSTVDFGAESNQNLIDFEMDGLWKNVAELIKVENTKPHVFMELRRIANGKSIDLPPDRKPLRGTMMCYVISVPAGSSLLAYHGFSTASADKTVKYEGALKVYHNDIKHVVEQGDPSVPLRPGDTVLVSDAVYSLTCEDPDGAVILMAGVDLGRGECAGRPCP